MIDGDSKISIEAKTNDLLETFRAWCATVKLTISATKITYVLMKEKLPGDPLIRLSGAPIQRSATTKYLSVELDGKSTQNHC